ncbi:MAG: ABC transporter ATP-binding protein [Methanothrix sp.]|nr:ABC transporter ATP-binding protein [Methanothrix sp.]
MSFPTPDGLVKAVDTVDLQIREGESVSLIGETGCGKTVLGLSIVRLLQPTTRVEGRILYQGRDLLRSGEDEMRRVRGKEISMILQNPNTSLNPVIRVGDQISEAIELHQHLNRSQAWRRAVEMLHSVSIPDPEGRARQYPHQLSGGMRQRVMIAMGLACEPRLIIADEPTKGLDPGTKLQIVDLIRRTSYGRSMLVITHDIGVAEAVSDRIAVMYAGELLEEGPAGSLISDPLHPYSRGLLSSLPSRGLVPIPGGSPSLISPPSGCRFHDRCPLADIRCTRDHPDLSEAEKGRRVRCLRYS